MKFGYYLEEASFSFLRVWVYILGICLFIVSLSFPLAVISFLFHPSHINHCEDCVSATDTSTYIHNFCEYSTEHCEYCEDMHHYTP